MRILAVEVKTQSHHPAITQNKVYSLNFVWQVSHITTMYSAH